MSRNGLSEDSTGWRPGNRITPSYVAFAKNGEHLIGVSFQLLSCFRCNDSLTSFPSLGDAAKNQYTSNPRTTFCYVKSAISSFLGPRERLLTHMVSRRLIGRSFSDEGVQADLKHTPFKVAAGQGGKPVDKLDVGGDTRQVTPEEISANCSLVEEFLKEGGQRRTQPGRSRVRWCCHSSRGELHVLFDVGGPVERG
jgi:molecular chaperone DnaK (HSP70)